MSRPKGSKNEPKQEIDCYQATATITQSAIIPPTEKPKYFILTDNNIYGLGLQVRQHIDNGFIPQGGVSVVTWQGINGREFLYSQAMLKV